MWPPEVEQVVAPLRAAGVEARVEELAAGEEDAPGPTAQAYGYNCDGRELVVLVDAESEPDPAKVAAAGGCRDARRKPPPPFPYTQAARVLLEQRLLTAETVWIRAGSPRYVIGLNPSILAQVTRASAADLSRIG
jgi:hypothetical protein